MDEQTTAAGGEPRSQSERDDKEQITEVREQLVEEAEVTEETPEQVSDVSSDENQATEIKEETPEQVSDVSSDEDQTTEEEVTPEEEKEEEPEILEPAQNTTEEPANLGSISSALKADLKSQVETVLFVTDTPIKTGALAKMLNTAYDDVQAALVQLIQEYEDRNGGLEIGTDDGYIIQVKTQYLNIVTEMMPLELNPGPTRTLSAIALKEPVLQSEIINMRGSGAYDHINELVEQDLVTKKPQGLSYVLRTTKKFQQYFRLSQEASKIKEKLQEDATKRAKQKEKERQEQEAQASQEQPPALEQEVSVSL